ncbi:hypothetical protein F66182_3097 [Fusarium sp. NRRL 66182]|nr:hypothetical protein F66182_3097 [Fusarium sp. NRRL 66182]
MITTGQTGNNDTGKSPIFAFQKDVYPAHESLGAGEDYLYAPYRVNPYYLQVNRQDYPVLFEGGSFDKREDEHRKKHSKGKMTFSTVDTASQTFYISLKFLRDLALDKLNLLGLSQNQNQNTISDDKNLQDGDELKSMDFAGLADDPLQPPLPTGFLIPIRTEQGYLAWMRSMSGESFAADRETGISQLKALKGLFNRVWQERLEIADGEYGASFRARYQDHNFDFGLCVAIEPALYRRLRCDDADEMEALVQSKINMINGKRLASKKKGLELRRKEDLKDYIKVSENPFGLYSTYIEPTQLAVYMESLGDYKKTVARKRRSGPTNQPASANSTNGAFNPVRDTPQDAQALVTYVNAYKNGRKPLVGKQKAESERIRKSWQDKQVPGYQTVLDVPISADKMGRARGKRHPASAPGFILGMSASQVAVENLRWAQLIEEVEGEGPFTSLVLYNGLYMAEWLHMSAFSWGGLLNLLDDNKEDQHSTSDIPENLVLGTSETNSQMTRFEKAWQDLVRDEALLQKSGFSGTLHVVRNPTELDPVQKRVGCHVKSEVIQSPSGFFSQARWGYKDGFLPEDSPLLQLSAIFPSLAYSISYSIEFDDRCEILNLDKGQSLETFFYPFLRPFYHTLEYQLDKALYEHMKERAPGFAQKSGKYATYAKGMLFRDALADLVLKGGISPGIKYFKPSDGSNGT